jgi:hypothetical protein
MRYRAAYVASAVATVVGFVMYKSFDGLADRAGGLLLMFGLAGSLLTRIADSIALLSNGGGSQPSADEKKG